MPVRPVNIDTLKAESFHVLPKVTAAEYNSPAEWNVRAVSSLPEEYVDRFHCILVAHRGFVPDEDGRLTDLARTAGRVKSETRIVVEGHRKIERLVHGSSFDQ